MRQSLTPRASGARAIRPMPVAAVAHAAFGLQSLEPRVMMSATGETVVSPLPAAHDAFVRDGVYAEVNAGGSGALVVKQDVRSYARHSYLSFDLGAVAGSVDRAVLRLYGRYEGPKTVPVAAYGVPNTGWDEAAVTWNARPATSASAAATRPVGGALGWYAWDVTNYVRAERAAGRDDVSLALKTSQFSTYLTVFASAEAAANPPQLVVTATVPPDAAPAAPAALSATVSGARVSLAWEASAGAATYNVYRVRVAAGGDPTALPSAAAPYRTGVKGTTFLDTAAAPQTGYRYAVSAVNAAGEGLASEPVAVTTAAAPVFQGRPAVAPLSPAGLAVQVGNGQVTLPDGSVVHVQPGTLRFDAPEVRSHTLVGHAPNNYFSSLKDGVWWSQATSLVPPVDTLMLGALYKSVIPGSIVVRSGDGSRTFVEGVDYKVNQDWGQVINLNGRLGAAGKATLRISYRYVTQRLDLLQVLPDGSLSVKKGATAVVTPRLPAPDPGAAALAGVYVYSLDGARESGFTVRDRDIFPINPHAVANTVAKLKSGKSVNIAWLGDSITSGAEAGQWWRDRSKTYTGLVASGLRQRFPGATVNEVAAYEGGLASTTAGAMFQDKVLKPHDAGQKIDLLVIALGMNDASTTGTAAFKSAMTNFIRQAKARGMDVLLVTTMPYNPQAEPLHTKLGPRAAIAQATRELGAREGVGVADVHTEWMNLATKGIAPLSQIHNMINHPGVDGMKVYADTILRFFK